mmetsp:Transcript_6600/g.8729  ORF Transcript_6600/g.8729 Transcript_6600/m.8729 type:complete len:284 (+) Transcript_6600:324-1175(+)
MSLLPSSTVQKESSTMMVWVRESSIIGEDDFPLSPTLSFVLFMMTLRSRPRVLSGRGIVTESSWRVCVHTYLPSTVPPFPSGGGELSSSSSSFSSLVVSLSSSSDLTGEFPSSCGIDFDFSSSLDEEDGSSFSAAAAGDCEMSNPPSASNSITPSSTFVFDASSTFFFSSASAAAFFFSASSFFFSPPLLPLLLLLLLFSLILQMKIGIFLQYSIDCGNRLFGSLVARAGWSGKEIGFSSQERKDRVEERFDALGLIGDLEVEAVEAIVVGEVGPHGVRYILR